MRNNYFCATLNLEASEDHKVLKLHQKRTYDHLARRYEVELSPNNKIYASNYNDLHDNTIKMMRSKLRELKQKKLTRKNEENIRKIRKALKLLRNEQLFLYTHL